MTVEDTVIVIGAGIVGVSSAIELRRRGHAVTLIDPKPPGSGASSGNAGCFNISSTVPVSLPGVARNVPRWVLDPAGPLSIRWRYLPQLAPWLWRFVRSGAPDKVEAQARALRSLLLSGVEDIRALAGSAGASDLVREEGHLVVYKTDAAFRADALAWRLRTQTGTRIEEWDGDRLHDFDPAIAPDYQKGIFIGENGHTPDPGRLVARLAAQFVREGGRIEAKTAIGFTRVGGRVLGVKVDGGVMPASAVLIATGAHAKPLARMLGDRVPLDTERGYHLMIADSEAMPRISILDTSGKFVATPMAGGLRLAGTVELAGINAAPDWRRADMLLRHARALFPALSESYPEARLSRWMGFRPSMPDSLPVIAPATKVGNAFYAFGHGHIGLASGATTGRIVADMMTGRPAGIDLAPFRADRF